jgi:hypothetical protein
LEGFERSELNFFCGGGRQRGGRKNASEASAATEAVIEEVEMAIPSAAEASEKGLKGGIPHP